MSLEDYATVIKTRRVGNEAADDSSPNLAQLEIDEIGLDELDDGIGDEPSVTITAEYYRPKDKHTRFDNHALIVRRRLKREAREWRRQWARLEIRDPVIQTAMRTVLHDVRHLNLAADVITIDEPYPDLFWFRDDFEKYRHDAARTAQERQSLALLESFTARHLKQALKVDRDRLSQGYITYDFLWTIFRPNALVIAVSDGLPRAYRVAAPVSETTDDKGAKMTIIPCLSWGYVDGHFGLSESSHSIELFTCARRIVDLEIFPLDRMPEPDRQDLVRELQQNGHQWRQLVRPSHRFYRGIAWEIVREVKSVVSRYSLLGLKHDVTSFSSTRIFIDGRIMVDETAFAREVPGYILPLVTWTPTISSPADLAQDLAVPAVSSTYFTEQDCQELFKTYGPGYDYHMTDSQALICPRTVRGYSLRDHLWAEFAVGDIRDITWNRDCFRQLQLDPQHKDVLESLIVQHGLKADSFRDIVAGKGRGLTILLYGPPGSGKTLTAETISEQAQKPLFCITGGQLGTDPTTAETRLQRFFRLAEAWRAILLLDEADVFLARRTDKDIVRNAFVSVFLRSMEWYGGIMMLTTNRRQDFDEAFQSRIHLQLPYRTPDADSRSAIWRNVLQAHQATTSFTDDDLARFGRIYPLNGRQLKNLILVALALSRSKAKALDEATVKSVYQIDYADSHLVEK